MTRLATRQNLLAAAAAIGIKTAIFVQHEDGKPILPFTTDPLPKPTKPKPKKRTALNSLALVAAAASLATDTPPPAPKLSRQRRRANNRGKP